MIRRKVLITGAQGQLGQQLLNIDHEKFILIGLTKEQLDITNYKQCLTQIERVKPDIIIHCAAYTAVDQAESEKDKAFLINEQGTLNLVKASHTQNCKFVYISTDYVFDGLSASPYEVDDTPNPQTIYGQTKLAGERVVQQYHEKYFIVRTSWVFGQYGHNFAKTMLKLAAQGKPISVVNDQIGSPTYTYHLAQFIYNLIETEQYGVYHATNSGQCSWYDFASYIFEKSTIDVALTPCTTEQFPRPAKRPAYSVLSDKQVKLSGLPSLPHWKQAVDHFINQQNEYTKKRED